MLRGSSVILCVIDDAISRYLKKESLGKAFSSHSYIDKSCLVQFSLNLIIVELHTHPCIPISDLCQLIMMPWGILLTKMIIYSSVRDNPLRFHCRNGSHFLIMQTWMIKYSRLYDIKDPLKAYITNVSQLRHSNKPIRKSKDYVYGIWVYKALGI